MKFRNRSQVPLPDPVHGKTKKIRVWENGISECHVFNINPKSFRTWGIILHHISHVLHPTYGAVKKLIELKTMKEVKDFEDLDPTQKYIATGFKDKLKEPIRGYKTRAEMRQEEQEATQRTPIYSESGRVTYNWDFLKQTEKLRNTVVYVALNGINAQPQKAVFRNSEMENTNLISSYCSKMLRIPDGISHFCTIYGRVLQDPKDFQHGYLYVAVPYGETFVNMDYMALFKKHYNYKKTKKPKVLSLAVGPHSTPQSRRSVRSVKSDKSRKPRTPLIDRSTKTKHPIHKTKNSETVPKMKNKVTKIDSKLASEQELKITYYTKSEEDHKPSYRARTVSSYSRQKLSNILKPPLNTNVITLSPEELIRSNEAPCESNKDDNDDETTVEQEKYNQINYEQQQFEQDNIERDTEPEANPVREKIIQENAVKKICDTNNYAAKNKLVQDCQQLVFSLWYDQVTKGIKKENENNPELQLINYQEPLYGVTHKLPEVYAMESCGEANVEQTDEEENKVTWRELVENEQKRKECAQIIYDIIQKISSENTNQEKEELDSLNQIKSDDNLSYYYVKLVTEGNQTSFQEIVSKEKCVQNNMTRQSFRHKPRNSKGDKEKMLGSVAETYLRSYTEPILSLSRQIMEADSSDAVHYHARRGSKKSVPRTLSTTNKRLPLEDKCSKKLKQTLSQKILSISKTIKTYEDMLNEVMKEIADDPIAQKLMHEMIKKVSCANTEETREPKLTSPLIKNISKRSSNNV